MKHWILSHKILSVFLVYLLIQGGFNLHKIFFYRMYLEYAEVLRVVDPVSGDVLVAYRGECDLFCPNTVRIDLESSSGVVLREEFIFIAHCSGISMMWTSDRHAIINTKEVNVDTDLFKSNAKNSYPCLTSTP